jgi:hypothetical protein
MFFLEISKDKVDFYRSILRLSIHVARKPKRFAGVVG